MALFRKMALFLLVLSMLTVPVGAMAFEDSGSFQEESPVYHRTDPAAMFVDAVAARPLGMASIVGGTATFIVSLPFSALGGNVPAAFNRLIVDPFKYTFARPLGDI